MEECDGGFSEEVIEVQTLQSNKLKGFKRTSPQENPELIRRIENCEKQVMNCPQCDFVTPSEIFFNEHMIKIHTGPNCPFCFLPFNGYGELRKHCTDVHDETKTRINKVKETSENWKSKKPCRYFKNGEGNCVPRNGKECGFNHNIIPFAERQECFHRQSCKYKPYCIFYHPEGQNVDIRQRNTQKISKVCLFSQQGLDCMKSECSYYHPTIRNQGFQWEQLKKPPIIENQILTTRVPVIVKNKTPLNKLSLSLRGLELD